MCHRSRRRHAGSCCHSHVRGLRRGARAVRQDAGLLRGHGQRCVRRARAVRDRGGLQRCQRGSPWGRWLRRHEGCSGRRRCSVTQRTCCAWHARGRIRLRVSAVAAHVALAAVITCSNRLLLARAAAPLRAALWGLLLPLGKRAGCLLAALLYHTTTLNPFTTHTTTLTPWLQPTQASVCVRNTPGPPCTHCPCICCSCCCRQLVLKLGSIAEGCGGRGGPAHAHGCGHSCRVLVARSCSCRTAQVG